MHGSFQVGGSNQGSQVAWGEGELQGHLAMPWRGGTIPGRLESWPAHGEQAASQAAEAARRALP